MTRVPTRRVLAVTALVVLASAGCAGAGDPGGPGAGDTPTAGAPGQGAPAPGGGLTVSEALGSDLDEPLTVRGLLIDADGTVRLCEKTLESYPPQCGDPSLEVEGIDVAEHPEAQREGDVVWVDQASVTGRVEDGVLRVDDTTA